MWGEVLGVWGEVLEVFEWMLKESVDVCGGVGESWGTPGETWKVWLRIRNSFVGALRWIGKN